MNLSQTGLLAGKKALITGVADKHSIAWDAVELEVGTGRVILLPPLDSLNYSNDRVPLANVLCDCLERMRASAADEPSQLIDKEAS